MAYSVTLLNPVPSIARWAFSYSGFGMLKVTYSSLERVALSLDGLLRNPGQLTLVYVGLIYNRNYQECLLL
jgi:hypothetical protein